MSDITVGPEDAEQALEAAQPGDTVRLLPGRYEQGLYVKQGVTVATIDGPCLPDAEYRYLFQGIEWAGDDASDRYLYKP